MLFQGVGKRDWYPTGYKFYGIYLAPWGNVYENNLDHWTPENPDGYFPRLKSYLANGAGDMSYNQTRYLQNAAYEISFNDEKYLIVPHAAILMLVRDEGLFE